MSYEFDAFLSHSSLDKPRVREIATILRSRGVRTWVDESDTKPGDHLFRTITEALNRCAHVILFMSRNSFASDWIQFEIGPALFVDPTNRAGRFVPVLLEDCEIPTALRPFKYIDLRRQSAQALEELLTACLNESDRGGKSSVLSLDIAIPPKLISHLVFLLLADRFKDGLWGRSLSSTAGAYGHGDDQGSVSVSQWTIRSLTRAFPGQDLEETRQVCSFLLDRMQEGTVGLRRNVGTPHAPAYQILQHNRHTAVAALMFRDYGSLDAALRCAVHLMGAQDRSGGWVDLGRAGGSPEPLTTAYALRCLMDFEADGYLDRIEGTISSAKRSTFKPKAFQWLYENLLEAGGWWLYDPSSSEDRAISYTVDVLLALPELASEPLFNTAYADLLSRLLNTWRINNGLPAGQRGDHLDLGTSAMFARVSWLLRLYNPELAAEIVPTFFQNLESSLATPDASAVGWCLIVDLALEVAPDLQRQLMPYGWYEDVSRELRQNRDEALDEYFPDAPDWFRRSLEVAGGT